MMGSATQLGEAQIPIRATLDKLDQDLAAARSRVGNAVEGIAANIRTAGGIALAGIGGAVTAIAGVVAGLAKVTIDAAPVEGVALAFEGLAESSGMGADEMLAALQRGSAGMVAQRDLMMSFNKAAGLVSTDFATQLPDAMQYLGKISAATGQDMGFLLDSLVVGVGRLSPMILDNLQVQVSLAEATERAAEMYGVEADALDKTQIQAGMMAVTLEKLAENTASMPDLTETAAAKMARLKAEFQDTKDRIGVALLPVLGTLLGTLGELADKVLPPLMNFIENTAGPILQALAGYFGTVATEGDSLNDWLTNLPADWQPVVQTIGSVIALLKDLLGGELEREYPWDRLFPPEVAEVVQKVADGLWELYDAVRPIAEQVMAFITDNVSLNDVLIAVGITIASVVLPLLWSLIAAVAPIVLTFLGLVAVVALLRAAWENDFLGIKTFVQDALASIKAWWTEHGDEVIAKAKEIWEGIKTAISEAIAAIQAWWAEHGDEIMAKAQEIWEGIKTAISDALERAKEIISTVIATIQEWWAAHGEEVTAKAQEIWDGVVATFEWFKEHIMLVFQAFKELFEGDWYGFGEKLREIWEHTWEKVKEIGQETWDAIKSFFTETDWGEVGRRILEGVAAGITGGLEIIKNAARNAANAALEAAKGFLGIESPSKVAASMIGEPFAAGIGAGIASALPGLMRAAESAGAMLAQSTAMLLPAWNEMVRPEGSGSSTSTTTFGPIQITTGAQPEEVAYSLEGLRVMVGAT